jgi:hypothetical protein
MSMPADVHILGISLALYTQIHVAISVIAIAAGLITVRGMLAARMFSAVTALFLITTMLTSLTGFLFPFHGMTPGIVIGILSVILLLIAMLALYAFHLVGAWRWIYVVTSIMALWFNVFVFIVQSFEKVPSLHALAPTQSEPPFKIAQLLFLVIFVILGIFSVRTFHPAPVQTQ